jgi:hypothetical protein
LFALFVFVLARSDRRWLWVLPLATVVWANVHGSFVTGWVLLGCVALGEAVRTREVRAAYPYALTLACCVLAALCTPFGLKGVLYVVTVSSNPVIRDLVTEWAPTTVDWREGVFLFGWLAGLGWLALRSRVRLTVTEMLVLLVFGWLALSGVRAIIWFALATAPLAARLLGGVLTGGMSAARERPALNVLVAGLTLALVAVSLPWTKSALPFLPQEKQALIGDSAPVRAGEYLRTHDPPVKGRMLNHETWGGYLDWAAWPRHQPFLDGRIELHPTQVWLDYLTIVFPGADWRRLLDQYEISYAVLSLTAQPDLIADLRREPGWRVDYEDEQAVIFSRALPESKA